MAIENDLLLRTLKNKSVERPPVWLMRQAGRILPNYRTIREKAGSFKKLVTNPEWIAEVTVEPVDVLGVDAAIIFSDILVVPEAMGLKYEIIENKGPLFEQRVENAGHIADLIDDERVVGNLDYVFDSIAKTKRALNDQVPLIGFAGAPWTIFAYMVEGSGSKTFSTAKKMLYKQPETAKSLLQKITNATIHYLKAKIGAGVNVLQLFDSWAGMLDQKTYAEFGWPYAKSVLQAINEVPTIFFPKGAWFVFSEFADSMVFDCLGIDWNTSPQFARRIMGDDIILQGNLDPCQLYAGKEEIIAATLNMLRSFGRHHIANLGHGVYPDTDVEKVKCFIDAVKEFSYSNI